MIKKIESYLYLRFQFNNIFIFIPRYKNHSCLLILFLHDHLLKKIIGFFKPLLCFIYQSFTFS